MNDRAIVYRKLNDIPESWGTAVNVQSMVFGNMGDDSGTGVAFTRDPATGENIFYGEFLMNAQGEDVVAGIRTPLPIASSSARTRRSTTQLLKIRRTLERHYRDMQDIEFTIQQGTLYMLQCRIGKRTGTAAVRIAVDMVDERLISAEARRCCASSPISLNQLLRPIFDSGAKTQARARRPAAGQRPQRRPRRRDRRHRVPRRGRRGAGGARASASSWCASRPRPRTSAAWRRPRAS